MNYLAIAAALAQGLIWFLTWLRRREAITDAEHAIMAAQAKGLVDEVAKVQEARKAARDRAAGDPGSVRRPTADDRPWNPDDSA